MMEQKLIKTELAEYILGEWDGNNGSGLTPVGDRVVILPDVAASEIRGIVLPDEIVGRHALAAETGIAVAIGDGAFKWNSDRVTPFQGRKPRVGERVVIHRYSGQVHKGLDGKIYRVVDSQEIGAIYG